MAIEELKISKEESEWQEVALGIDVLMQMCGSQLFTQLPSKEWSQWLSSLVNFKLELNEKLLIKKEV